MTDFVKLLNEEIDESEGLEGLFGVCQMLYGMKDFAGIRDYCVPKWKDKARRLVPSWNTTKVAAIDMSCIPHDTTDSAVSYLRTLYKQLSPTEFIVCSGEEHKKYSATLDTLRAKVCVEEHRSCTDTMATIALQCALLGSRCVLVADDQRLWQCLYNGVAMYDHAKQAYINQEWLMATHRIKREQVVDWLTLVRSGISEELEASNWLQAYGDFIGALNATRNGKLSDFFEERYWAEKEKYTLHHGTPVRWFSWTKDNK